MGLPALGQALPAAASAKPRSQWFAQLELASRYDDNITELSDTDQRRLKDAACLADPSCASRFRIESADDIIVSPSGRIEWARASGSGVETSVAGDVRLNHFIDNSFMDYQVYALRFAQGLSPTTEYKTTLALRAAYTPFYYLRELTVPEASRVAGHTLRDSAQYAAAEFGATIRQVLAPKQLVLEAKYETERRDYDAPFDERDGDLSGWRADLFWWPGGSRAVTLGAGYRSLRYDAAGDQTSTIAIEPDISSDRDALLLGADFRWGRRRSRGSVELSYTHEQRTFTTTQPADIYHFGRKDTRTRFGVTVRQGVTAHFYVEGGYMGEKNDSRLGPGAPASTTGDDVTDFTKNVFSLAAGWRF